MKEPQENRGWIALYRKLLENPVSNNPEFLSVWVHLLLMAQHKKTTFIWNGKKQTLESGQLITGRKELSKKTTISESKVYRILKYLEIEQQIEQQTYTKFTVITIVNWSKYQKSEQQLEQQMNNKRTTDEQQMNTYNNVNKVNNENNENKLSKDKEQSSGYGSKVLNNIKLLLREEYPLVLQGIEDRRLLYNFQQALTPRKDKDEWLSQDPLENTKRFISEYNTFQPNNSYKVASLRRLKELAQTWREYGGKFEKEENRANFFEMD
jgi:hypothetical protein